MTVADTFFGATIAFTTQSTLAFDIIEGGRSGVTSVDIETSHAGTSGGSKTYIPGDLIEGGTYEFTVAHDGDVDEDSFVGVSDTITITYPQPAGQMTAPTKAFTGWVNSYDEALPIEDRMTASMSTSTQISGFAKPFTISPVPTGCTPWRYCPMAR